MTTTLTGPFYIIETEDIGQDGGDARIDICTEPALTNQSHEVMTNGWCGTTNNIGVTAHGEFGTLAEAQLAICEFGEIRAFDAECDDPVDPEKGVVESFFRGQFRAITEQEANGVVEWAAVEASWSDEDCAEQAELIEQQMNDESGTTADRTVDLEQEFLRVRDMFRADEREAADRDREDKPLTCEELELMPEGFAVYDDDGDTWRKITDGGWIARNSDGVFKTTTANLIVKYGPVMVRDW